VRALLADVQANPIITADPAVPIIIPEFAQFQGTLFPLRGLWHARPPEGDRFVNAEIQWGTLGTGVGCVQFQLSGNSPVAFSQIVAMSVDNRRCSSNVDFLYPDSGFVLAVPAFNQGVYPVFTNALMFYANSPGADIGDRTIVQVLNSMPPPVAIQPASEQSQASVSGVVISTPGTTPVALGSGTLNAFSVAYNAQNTGSGNETVTLQLIDGTGSILWADVLVVPPGAQSNSINLSGLQLSFSGGINLVVTSPTITAGSATVNLYYSVP